MSDQSMSKSAKKNAKRAANKKKTKVVTTSNDTTYRDMLQEVKQQLEVAKTDEDHDKAGKLRDQVWVLTDLVAGVKTDIPQDELLKILENIEVIRHKSKEASTSAVKSKPVITATEILTTEEKRIRTLKKKLVQVDILIEKQKKGDKLEKSQIDKIDSAKAIQEEIDQIEELLQEVVSLH